MTVVLVTLMVVIVICLVNATSLAYNWGKRTKFGKACEVEEDQASTGSLC